MRTLLMVLGFALPLGALAEETTVAPCASTPEAAVRAYEGGAKLGGAEGYRVASLRRDAVLGMNWAAVERCGHPAWPAVAVRTVMAPPAPVGLPEVAGVRAVSGGRLAAIVEQRAPLVRAGQTVRLWQQDVNVRLQLPAVSEQNGAAGDRIRMHVGGNGDTRTVYGLVRGTADVEMER